MSQYYLAVIKILLAGLIWWGCNTLVPLFVALIGRSAKLSLLTLGHIRRILKIALIVIVAVFLTDSLGIAPANIWTSLTALTGLVAVGFIAYWSALSNQICGFILLAARPFTLGDEIEVIELFNATSPARGVVQELTPIYTILKTKESQAARIFIPHNLLLQKTIKVYDKK